MYQIMAEYWRLHKIAKIRTNPSNLIQKCRYFIITLCSAALVFWRWAAMGHTEKSREISRNCSVLIFFALPNWPSLTFSCQGLRKQMKQNNSLNCKSIFLYCFEVTLNPVGNGIQLISGTGSRKELLTDVTAQAVF